MQAMTLVSPDLNFARDSRPALVYRTGEPSDRELLKALLRLIRELTEQISELTEKDERTA